MTRLKQRNFMKDMVSNRVHPRPLAEPRSLPPPAP
jgi:hypothetical protein